MIRRFVYQNLADGWTLDELWLGRLNLLVGVSGVGKTRILSALRDVRRVGLRGAPGVDPASWELSLAWGGKAYAWSVRTAATGGGWWPPATVLRDGDESEPSAHFERERVEAGGETVVDRASGAFQFQGTDLPRLQPTESAIELLQSEPPVAALHEALKQWRFLDVDLQGIPSADLTAAERDAEIYQDLEALRRSGLPPSLKLFVLQRNHPEELKRLEAEFRAIFPSVLELRSDTQQALGTPLVRSDWASRMLTIGIREEGVEGWVTRERWSAGMWKTLLFLTELELAPDGSVVLVDEVEDGLGINCLSDVTDLLVRHSQRLQIIATSHHPYIINNIPFSAWRLVSRKGSVVEVLDAGKIEALRSSSRLDRFVRLINLPEYEEGIA